MPRLDIVIGCDADPDRHELTGEAPSGKLHWNGIRNGIPLLKEKAQKIVDTNGKQPVITWCWRSDEQITQMEGDAAYIPRVEKSLMESLKLDGDEHAWHAHVWKMNQQSKQWYQESHDTPWQRAMLQSSYQALKDALGEVPVSLRTGWTFHNQTTFHTVAELGIQVDFSALPGLRIDPPSEETKSGANYFDWMGTPYLPYRPDRTDHRRASGNGSSAYESILEAPCTVVPSFLWGMIGGGVLTLKMRDPRIFFRTLRRPTYLVTIPTAPKFFAPMATFLSHQMRSKQDILFVTYFHADELVAQNHRLYSLESFVANLKDLLIRADKAGYQVAFRQAREIPYHWAETQ
jgi:hypothetical protein